MHERPHEGPARLRRTRLTLARADSGYSPESGRTQVLRGFEPHPYWLILTEVLTELEGSDFTKDKRTERVG